MRYGDSAFQLVHPGLELARSRPGDQAPQATSLAMDIDPIPLLVATIGAFAGSLTGRYLAPRLKQ